MKKVPLIYIVEDSPIVQYLIELSLKREFKCKTVKFENIHDALAGIRKQVPDVMVLDYTLDHMMTENLNGLALLKQLSKMKLQIPTVVFSGQSEKNVAVDLIRHGAVDYVSKEGEDFALNLVKAVKKVLDVIRLNESLRLDQLRRQKSLRKTIGITGVVLLFIIAFSCSKLMV